ncbi:MAG: hypothetical protein QXV01_10445, partial [Candidatus Bathyarchaeia archaeon]
AAGKCNQAHGLWKTARSYSISLKTMVCRSCQLSVFSLYNGTGCFVVVSRFQVKDFMVLQVGVACCFRGCFIIC